jgi:DNA-binding transcriptional LysR family regulator
MLPSTTDLFYFYTVALELHFSRAAKKLHVSQPSLSIAIKKLENLLDTNLFIRHKQGVTLTQTGEKLFDNVKKIFLLWEETVSVIKETKQYIKGVIRIGCHSTITPFLSDMVSQLLNQYPELQIHFHNEISLKVMENRFRCKNTFVECTIIQHRHISKGGCYEKPI